MKFAELLQHVTDNELDFLSAETRVNKQVKKRKGSLTFKLILYSMLENDKPPLRRICNPAGSAPKICNPRSEAFAMLRLYL
jgi:hypothetical protein